MPLQVRKTAIFRSGLLRCDYRHEKPVENDLSHQNMQDRYYGRNDPVARKIMATHADSQGLTPPDDQSIVCALCWLLQHIHVGSRLPYSYRHSRPMLLNSAYAPE